MPRVAPWSKLAVLSARKRGRHIFSLTNAFISKECTSGEREQNPVFVVPEDAHISFLNTWSKNCAACMAQNTHRVIWEVNGRGKLLQSTTEGFAHQQWAEQDTEAWGAAGERWPLSLAFVQQSVVRSPGLLRYVANKYKYMKRDSSEPLFTTLITSMNGNSRLTFIFFRLKHFHMLHPHEAQARDGSDGGTQRAGQTG